MIGRCNIQTNNPILRSQFSRLNRETELSFMYNQKHLIDKIVGNINKTGNYVNVIFDDGKVTLRKINPVRINISLRGKR